MRILLLTNAPWNHTGYGIQCKGLIKQFAADGHKVAVLANSGLVGNAIEWHGIPVYSTHRDRLGVDAIAPVCSNFGAQLVIILYDIWAYPPDIGKYIPVPWIAYAPLDGEPIPPAQLQRLRQAHYVLAMSRHAQGFYERAGLDSTYIPLSVDADVFKPGDKLTAREALGLDQEAFVVTSVGANKGFPPRKSWPEIMHAFALFLREVPEALLYIHSTKRPYASDTGVVFSDLRQHYGIHPDHIAFPEEEALFIGVPASQMAQIYQASDVFLLPSRGEGFGVPLVEAQLCGCPVVTQKWTAMEELTHFGAWSEPLAKMWHQALAYNWAIPDANSVADNLKKVYDAVEPYYTDSQDVAIHRLTEDYNWPNVYQRHWKPFLERAEVELW